MIARVPHRLTFNGFRDVLGTSCWPFAKELKVRKNVFFIHIERRGVEVCKPPAYMLKADCGARTETSANRAYQRIANRGLTR
ncbi:hypothetical protein RISW2_17045 [Roseivivax isoporae LMG 25204]|uniref:Uncharacterized protein n=1 Tax=Roseivivax isoporae LMG 25204 TaxID=1449351 RepID=X7F2B1_9RHOB|nr:hypothetical protein RISW2_17045 [Roseivivax isoporae LMG 25204]